MKNLVAALVLNSVNDERCARDFRRIRRASGEYVNSAPIFLAFALLNKLEYRLGRDIRMFIHRRGRC